MHHRTWNSYFFMETSGNHLQLTLCQLSTEAQSRIYTRGAVAEILSTLHSMLLPTIIWNYKLQLNVETIEQDVYLKKRQKKEKKSSKWAPPLDLAAVGLACHL